MLNLHVGRDEWITLRLNGRALGRITSYKGTAYVGLEFGPEIQIERSKARNKRPRPVRGAVTEVGAAQGRCAEHRPGGGSRDAADPAGRQQEEHP